MEKKKYPIGPEYYELYEEIGQGVSASVSRALCTSLDEVVAIKILDFERDNCNLNNISREAQTMVLIDHPNVLKSHCSFVSDHNLWVVMPFMAGGSALHILKAVFPDGFEEVVIATILREVLKGLEYLHHHGHIHRDVKAGNILIDARGGIKLGDFGVSACLFDSGDRQRTRNTFVGTPCWMAPEVMEPLHGYDFKADIWSFGITALELAHGHAPFSKYPPMKVLLMTLQNAPPGLDYERDRKFSKSFKQMIASCLVKDPSKRPTAKKLLKHHFFKQARSNDYISRTLLEGLPAIGDRIKELKRKEEYMLAQKKMPDGEMEELSQNEYKRGISGWNFNLEDVKAQASLIPDDEPRSEKEQGGSSNSLSALEMQPNQCSAQTEDCDPGQNQDTPRALAVYSAIDNIKAKCDKSDDELSISSSIYENNILQINSPPQEGHFENIIGEKYDLEINGRTFDGLTANYQRKGSSLSVAHMPEAFVLPNRGGESNKLQNQAADDAPSEIPSRASKSVGNSDELDEEAKVPVVQQKGRFKVTSENVDLEKVVPSPMLQKSLSLQVGKSEVITQQSAIALQTPSDVSSSNLIGHSLFPMLHSILQTNILQRESILNLMKQVSVGESAARMNDGASATLNTVMTEKSLLEAAHDREKELLHEISELQWRLIRVQEELQKYKTDNSLLNP